ncbi:MAG TPA: glycosyltransferase family 2 protein [Gemmataceae bacterium]|nr:glycosyltransferase family 2 protein [Gemmataceae bacterium]
MPTASDPAGSRPPRAGGRARAKVSIVCPCYNEETGIASAVARLKQCLDQLPNPVEVLLINDGSVDATLPRAIDAIAGDSRFRVLSHKANYGRGRALRTGIQAASGEIIVTTEGDLSWGRETIERMIVALERDPGLDAVFASTHLPGGGYERVPRHRVLLSKFGNRVLHLLYTGKLTMVTGMTRAYRAGTIQGHSFQEDGKEIHLEIAHRLLKLGKRIGEVPAVLSWPDKARGSRTDWSKIARLVSSHLAFGVFRGLSRIIGPVVLFVALLIGGFGSWAVWRLLHGTPSIFLAQLTAVLVILWVTLTLGYFLAQHAVQIEINVWKTQAMLAQLLRQQALPASGSDYFEEVPIVPRSPTDGPLDRAA